MTLPSISRGVVRNASWDSARDGSMGRVSPSSFACKHRKFARGCEEDCLAENDACVTGCGGNKWCKLVCVVNYGLCLLTC
jgi:hypothetical protein